MRLDGQNLKNFNGIKGTEDNLTGIAKANFNTEHGIRNLVLWGKEVDENSYLSLGILKRLHKYYGTDNSEIKFKKYYLIDLMKRFSIKIMLI